MASHDEQVRAAERAAVEETVRGMVEKWRRRALWAYPPHGTTQNECADELEAACGGGEAGRGR